VVAVDVRWCEVVGQRAESAGPVRAAPGSFDSKTTSVAAR
jgi:hypothetical protein